MSPCGFTLESFNYALVHGLMLFIQISCLLLVLWPFPSRSPSCLLSGVLQPLSLGKDCVCAGVGVSCSLGWAVSPRSISTVLSFGFVVSLAFILCHPFSYPFYCIFPLQVEADLSPEVAPAQLELPCAVLPTAGK